MSMDHQLLADFRRRLGRAKEADAGAWEASSRLLARAAAPETLARLAAAIRGSAEPTPLREALLEALRDGKARSVQDLSSEALKPLTGLPATKAVRALCLYFGLLKLEEPDADAGLSSARVEALLRRSRNPFDLLVEAEDPSLLDLGAGDLSFAEELARQVVPRLAARSKTLTLHCVDRLKPGSALGGRLHADRERLDRLRGRPGLAFRFWGDQDMFELDGVKGLKPRYTIAACYAPPTPTCALEPTRLSPGLVAEHLRRTKGEFRPVREDGEPALEVRHRGRTLLFPPWKFEVRGPLALLDLVARRGRLAVLASVDGEVFWELLAQLLAEDRFRPRDVIFEEAVLPEVFGEVHRRLAALKVGESLVLSDVAALRAALPRPGEPAGAPSSGFRYVEVRRGATFPDVPASLTARLFTGMSEEPLPWFLTLVPDVARKSDDVPAN
jgi:hypothetical protein